MPFARFNSLDFRVDRAFTVVGGALTNATLAPPILPGRWVKPAASRGAEGLEPAD